MASGLNSRYFMVSFHTLSAENRPKPCNENTWAHLSVCPSDNLLNPRLLVWIWGVLNYNTPPYVNFGCVRAIVLEKNKMQMHILVNIGSLCEKSSMRTAEPHLEARPKKTAPAAALCVHAGGHACGPACLPARCFPRLCRHHPVTTSTRETCRMPWSRSSSSSSSSARCTSGSPSPCRGPAVRAARAVRSSVNRSDRARQHAGGGSRRRRRRRGRRADGPDRRPAADVPVSVRRAR